MPGDHWKDGEGHLPPRLSGYLCLGGDGPGRSGANTLTNLGLGRRLGSAAFHDTLVEVERLVVREGE